MTMKIKPCKDCGTAIIIWRAGTENRVPAWHIECLCGLGDIEPVHKPIYAEQLRKKRKLIERWNRRMNGCDGAE